MYDVLFQQFCFAPSLRSSAERSVAAKRGSDITTSSGPTRFFLKREWDERRSRRAPGG